MHPRAWILNKCYTRSWSAADFRINTQSDIRSNGGYICQSFDRSGSHPGRCARFLTSARIFHEARLPIRAILYLKSLPTPFLWLRVSSNPLSSVEFMFNSGRIAPRVVEYAFLGLPNMLSVTLLHAPPSPGANPCLPRPLYPSLLSCTNN